MNVAYSLDPDFLPEGGLPLPRTPERECECEKCDPVLASYDAYPEEV